MDLSSFCGWAYGGLTDPLPAFGVWQLPRIGGEGARYAAFENELAEAMDAWKPSRLVLEAPMSLMALIGASTLKVMCQQLGLRAIAYAEAWRASAAVNEVSADMVRLALLGQARFAKGQVKHEVVRYCRARGLAVRDHNAADACCVWFWLVGQLTGKAPVAGRLFQERVH